MSSSPNIEDRGLDLSTDDLTNSGNRTKNAAPHPPPSDSEDTSSSINDCPSRFSVWRLRCDTAISKERLRHQLRRSKTHVEGHVCYPWLRRLFFHLSHYFPNLHTTRSANRRTKSRAGAAAASITGITGQVGSNTANVAQLYKNGRRTELGATVSSPSMPFCQTGRPSGSRSPYNVSPHLSYSSGYQSRRKSLSPKSHMNEDKRVSSNRKRRPLQRQKFSDTLDFDQFFAKAEAVLEETNATSSTQEADKRNALRSSSSESRQESLQQRNRNYMMNMSPQASVDRCSNSGRGDPLATMTRTEPRLRTTSSRQAPLSPHNRSGTRRPSVAHQQWQNSESQSSGLLEQGNIRSEMFDLQTTEEISPADAPVTPTRWTSHTRAPIAQNTRSSGLKTQSSENRSVIQYRRVKARRNSSNSQVETGPGPVQVFKLTKDDSPNCLLGQDEPISPTFPPLDSELSEDRSNVNKHVESWLEKTVQLTRQNQSRRRRNIYHICSGDANFEPPPTQVAQPHSFDSPVPSSLYEPQNAQSLFTSPRRVIQRQLQCSSQQSSDSPQFILPSMTIDSNEGYPSYRMGDSLEQDSRPSGELGYSFIQDDPTYPTGYRRHSENPIGRCRQPPQNSMSIESATGIVRTESQSRAFCPPVGLVPGASTMATVPVTPASVAGVSPAELFLQTPSHGRERASSFQETGQSLRRKIPPVNEFSTNQNPLRHTAERTSLMKMAIMKQSRSFSSPRRGSRSPTIQSLREDSDAKPHPPAVMHTPNKLLTRNPPNSLQQLAKQQTAISCTGSCPYCPNCRPQFARRRESQMSSGLPGSTFPEASENLLKHPIASTFFERRYSHHLKPLDAWNSRQSHSMELVNTSHHSSRGLTSGGRQPLTSKLSLQRQVPQLYSRSMQQSTCSFPAQWCGFLSGPELSLTSPFDSSSITPDSQKMRHFFEQSFDGVERVMTTTTRILDHTTHVHSASGSPGYPHVRNIQLDRYMRGLQDTRDQFVRSNLLCSPQAFERNRDRRVKSFELNLPADRGHEPKRQSNLMLPNHYSSDSSRRGSALSNTSVRSAREFTPRIDECHDDRNQLVTEPIVTSTPTFTGKLIPPDLIFSPASRRASIMDEQERNSPDPTIPPMLLNRNPALVDPMETIEIEPRLPYCESVEVDKEPTTNQTYTSSWLHDMQAHSYSGSASKQSPIDERVPQASLDPEARFVAGWRGPGINRSFHSSYSQNERRMAMFEMEQRRDRQYQDYHSMEGLTGETFCTPLSHSHDDLRRSRKQFAATSATTYPTSNFYPRFPDSHAYPALTKSLAPLLTTSGLQARSIGGSVFPHKPRGRHILSGSENRSAMSSYEQPVEWSGTNERTKRSPNRKKLNPSTSDMGTAAVCLVKKRSVQGVHSDPVNKTEESITVHLNLDKCVRGNYLFRSTSTGESNVDPKLLEPSLCPVLDSSEENITDGAYEDESGEQLQRPYGRPRSSGAQKSVDNCSNTETVHEKRRPTSEHHAARRRSFLARYWQQAIQRSGDDSLDSPDTLCTEKKD